MRIKARWPVCTTDARLDKETKHQYKRHERHTQFICGPRRGMGAGLSARKVTHSNCGGVYTLQDRAYVQRIYTTQFQQPGFRRQTARYTHCVLHALRSLCCGVGARVCTVCAQCTGSALGPERWAECYVCWRCCSFLFVYKVGFAGLPGSCRASCGRWLPRLCKQPAMKRKAVPKKRVATAAKRKISKKARVNQEQVIARKIVKAQRERRGCTSHGRRLSA